MHRLLGMVGHIQRRVPECHHRIANVFVDGAAMILNNLGHGRKVSVQHLGQFGWRQCFGEIGKAAYVREQHGHLTRLTFHAVVRGILAHLVGQLRRHILAEQFGDLALVARFGQKSVSGG